MQINAFIFVYNEEAMIENCILNARKQGLYPIVIDNGCTDGTMGIVKGMCVPMYEHITTNYNVYEFNEWAIARMKEMGCDWYVQLDADEVFESYGEETVAEVVSEADAGGYNCIRFDLYEFWPTEDDDMGITDIAERIRYYSYYDDNHLKLIKNSPEINTICSHRPRGELREYPEHLIMRHFKFVGLEQGRQKVKDRLARFFTTTGVNMQYNEFTNASRFYVLPEEVYSGLNKFDGTWIKEKVFNGWRGY